MRCPHCGSEIPVSSVCPRCGQRIGMGGNTMFFKKGAVGSLSVSDIFSDVFKKHPSGSAERALLSRQASAGDMFSSWTKPFMFARLFGFLLVVVILMGLFVDSMPTALVTPMLFLGAGLVPFTVFLFIWEMDIPRGISIFESIGLILIGGLISLFIAATLNDSAGDAPAYIAGFTEEPTKLLISCLFILAVQGKRRIYALDGLAIGAAVAAGFAFMETISYSLNYNGWDTLIMRSVLALCSHILYTAPFVGALGLAMNGRKLSGSCFADKRFLVLLALGVGEHMLNNADILSTPIINSDSVYIGIKHVIIFITSWAALIYMFKQGIAEVMGVTTAYSGVGEVFRQQPVRPQAVQAAQVHIVGMTGEFKGRTIPVSAKPLVFGRDPSVCSIIINSPSVSRTHCVLMISNGQLMLRDNNSGNGTFVNGARVRSGAESTLRAGDTFGVADAGIFRVQ